MPRGIWLKKLLPSTTQGIHILKRSFGNLYGISRVCTHFVGSNRANNCLHRQQVCHPLFPKKAIPPTLWNACDYLLQFNFKIAHIAGSVNTAADFRSRFQLKITEKIRLKIREDFHTTPIEVTTSSSDSADEEQFFFTEADNASESEEQTLEPKEQSRQNAKQWAANEESPVLKTSVKEFTNIDGNTTSCSMNGIKAKATIRVEQDNHLVLKNMKLKILGQPYVEVSMITDSRYKNYKANEDRIILKDGLLFRKFFEETGSVKYCQNLTLKQLVREVLRSCMENLASTQEFIKQ